MVAPWDHLQPVGRSQRCDRRPGALDRQGSIEFTMEEDDGSADLQQVVVA